MTMTQRDAQALTYLAGRLREETKGATKWDEHGTYAVIAKLIGQNLATSIEQVVRHAGDFEAKTPGAINRPFLPAPKPKDNTWRPPKRTEECRKHPGQWPNSCGPCATDAVAAYHDEETPVTPIPNAVEACRASLRGGGDE